MSGMQTVPSRAFSIASGILGVLYLALYLTKAYLPQGQLVFGVLNTLLQLALDLYALSLAQRLFRRRGGIFNRLLVVAFALSALTGALYGTCLQILGMTEFSGKLEIAINALYLGYLVSAGTALAAAEAGGEIGCLLSASLGFTGIMLFGPRIFAVIVTRQTQVIHFLCLMAESYLFGFAFIRALMPKSRGMRAIGLGFTAIALYGYLLQFVELYAQLISGLPLELLWTAGQFLIVSGLRARERTMT